jgi:hypothetical protein
MNTAVRKVSLFLLLSASALVAQANPGPSRADRETIAGMRAQQESTGRNEAQTVRNFQYPESNRSAEEGLKKQSRLSPEERRILRRQINEAGQDLYIRKP